MAMWKTWINNNTNSVAHCGGGKAGRAEDGGLPGSSGRAATLAHDLIVAKRLGFSGVGVALVSPIGI